MPLLKIKKGGVNIKPVKKGNIVKSQSNESLLMAEDKTAYKVSPTVLTIWEMCDGTKTQEQIVDSLSEGSKTRKAEISETVSQTLASLEEVKLIQKN